MDNQDKIFEKIKEASQNQQAPDFASMEKVWQRVEDKLDNKVLTKQNKLWKKIAIAASFLLVFTVSYQIFKPSNEVIIPKNKIATTDSVKTKTPVKVSESTAVVEVPEQNPMIKKDAGKILKQQINNTTEIVALNENIQSAAEMTAEPSKTTEYVNDIKEKDTDDEILNSGKFRKAKAFDARSVRQETREDNNYETDKKTAERVAEKASPLVVIDGKAMTEEKGKQSLENLSGLDPDDVKEIVVLKEPLYIINGSYYSEQQLFGPNPTSPYHPLNQQEIETLSILQGEKAIAAYGKKGEKGVVIITTKNGKPLKKSTRKEP